MNRTATHTALAGTLATACVAFAAPPAPAPAAVDYGWLDEQEHREALDWPAKLVETYRDADPDVLMIEPLATQADPRPTDNDNFARPIATVTPAPGGTIIAVTIRQRYHAPIRGTPTSGPRIDENTTNLYMKRSTDRGRTWSGFSIPHTVGGLEPFPVKIIDDFYVTGSRAQNWGAGWGRSLGMGRGDHAGTVYAAGHEGFYTSDDEGESWKRVEVKRGLERNERRMYLAPEIRTHPKAGLVLLGHLSGEAMENDTSQLAVATSNDGGVTWDVQHVDTGKDFDLREPSFDHFPDSDDFFVFSRRASSDPSPAPAQGTLSLGDDGKWTISNLKTTDIPYGEKDQDTHGVFYNPVSQRFEAAVSYRGSAPDDDHMKVSLFSLPLEDAKAGRSTGWRYDGTIQDHVSGYGNGDNYGSAPPPKSKMRKGKGEGQHTGGFAHDGTYAYITFGSGPSSDTWANSYVVRRTLDTDRLRQVLLGETE